MKLQINISILLLLVSFTIQAQQNPAREKFVNELMAKMTLDEKIGQLNLPTSGDITTGQANSSNIAKKN